MEPRLPDDFTDRVMEKARAVLGNYCGAGATVSGAGIEAAYEQTVLHGLFSGEDDGGAFDRFMRKRICAGFVNREYFSARRDERKFFRSLIRDAFDASYKIGKIFAADGAVKTNGGRNVNFPDEAGVEILLEMGNGIGIGELGKREDFARGIWNQYSRGRRPRCAA